MQRIYTYEHMWKVQFALYSAPLKKSPQTLSVVIVCGQQGAPKSPTQRVVVVNIATAYVHMWQHSLTLFDIFPSEMTEGATVHSRPKQRCPALTGFDLGFHLVPGQPEMKTDLCHFGHFALLMVLVIQYQAQDGAVIAPDKTVCHGSRQDGTVSDSDKTELSQAQTRQCHHKCQQGLLSQIPKM